jgi:hypothetical protein
MSSSRMRAGAVLLALCWLAPTASEARKQQELRYRIDQVWNAALRLVRVDLKLPVTDRDQEGGYVMFDYLAAGKRHPGSVELIAQGTGPSASTVVVVQVQGMPSYVEQMIVDRLSKKLQTEFGAPKPLPKRPAASVIVNDAGPPAPVADTPP